MRRQRLSLTALVVLAGVAPSISLAGAEAPSYPYFVIAGERLTEQGIARNDECRREADRDLSGLPLGAGDRRRLSDRLTIGCLEGMELSALRPSAARAEPPPDRTAAEPTPDYPPRAPTTERIAAQDEAVLVEINRARADPQRYAEELREYETRFRGSVAHEPGDRVGRQTFEGVAAVEEAARYVDAQASRPPLRWSSALAGVARAYSAAQGPTGAVGHVGPDGSTLGDRSARYGASETGEIISYGLIAPRAVVRQFIVDDGVADRGHRTAVFSDGFRVAGVGCGPHARYQYMCVVDLASNMERSR